MTLRLTALNVYPVKSAGGISLEASEVDDFGLRHDRRWMVVDQAGKFISQRAQPRLALVRPSFGDGSLRLTAPGLPELELPLRPGASVTTTVVVWESACAAIWAGERAAGWFSDLLGCHCSLVYMPDESVRPANPRFAPEGTRVSFADAYPFLLISEESLADLNGRLSAPMPMNRFRPNLVIAGAAAYVEDTLGDFSLGGIAFRAVKPCARCVITTTDQATGERGAEPLRTLATYRKGTGQVLFGQNVVHFGRGRVRVGDPLVAPGTG